MVCLLARFDRDAAQAGGHMSGQKHYGQPRTVDEARLARRLSPVSVWALSLGCIIGWGSFILPGTTFLPQAGPAGTLIALAVAAVVMVVIALNYSYLIGRYPFAGGEFAYVHDTLGPGHAFATSWLLGLCYLALVAQNATALALVGRSLLGGVFQVGFHYTVAGYEVYAGELALALGALVLFAVLNVRGVRLAGVFQTVLVVAIVAVVGIVVAGAFEQLGPAVATPQPAFSPTANPVGGVLAVLAIAPFLFVGFDTIPQAAEEYRFSPAKTTGLIVVSIAFGACIYGALALLAAAVPASGFADWPSYLASASQLDGFAALPTFNAAFELLGPAGLAVLGAAACGAILSGIVGFYVASSRLLFALARDGLLPAWFARIHPVHRTPYLAIVFVCAVAAIAPFFGRTVLGWLVDMSSLGAAVAYGYASLVACIWATREKRRALMASGALGVLFSVGFVVLLLVPLPGSSASLGAESYVCLLVWAVLGIAFFARAKRRSRGAGR